MAWPCVVKLQRNMFGSSNSNPFGQKSSGSSPFAPATPFGTSAPLDAQTGSSSTCVFGAPQASTPFASTTTFEASSSPAFENSTPAFGASQASSTFGAFGQKSSGSSPFGSQSQTSNSSSNNPFAPATPFGAQTGSVGTSTGAPQASSPFSSTTTFGASSSPAFENSTPAFGASQASSPFGSSDARPYGLRGTSWKLIFMIWLSLTVLVKATTDMRPDDVAMQALTGSLIRPDDIPWGDTDYCTWPKVDCDENGRVTSIRLSNTGISGCLPPELKNLTALRVFEVMDNQITGIIPSGFTELQSLQVVALSRNLFQGPTPKFNSKVIVDMSPGSNSFCLDSPGASCDPRVDALVSIAGGFNYPLDFAKTWKGNDPCRNWRYISCNEGQVSAIIIRSEQLTGTISPRFGDLATLLVIDLSHNHLNGIIPVELTKLKKLRVLDLSYNQLHGKVPQFGRRGILNIEGNPDTETDNIQVHSQKSSKKRKILVGLSIGILLVALLVTGICIGFYLYQRRKKNLPVQPAEISLDILKDATENFSSNNILGEGGFGTVFKGTLQDGRDIAVKRMDVRNTRTDQFRSEVSVLTRVHHRNLVTLYGYCIRRNERMLVYEYMPQGTLSRHLFHWEDQGLRPLDWTRRLTVALDVARGVEYLHTLALPSQSYIHRDLKPTNILLGEDMRAKVSDFGLVRSTPEGRASINTNCGVGTYGYMAPEYVTGRITRKFDVYSFGVILMELITGQKALSEARSEADHHIVVWFRKMLREDSLPQAIDGTVEVNQETQGSINEVSQLANQCCAREPDQRPDMAHVVNVLASLTEQWRPSEIQELGGNQVPPEMEDDWREMVLSGRSGV